LSLLQIEQSGPVTTFTIDRAESMNPLGNSGDGAEFEDACRAINEDMSVRCVILTGAQQYSSHLAGALWPARPRDCGGEWPRDWSGV